MSEDEDTRKQLEEDAREDLEVEDEDADKVGGAFDGGGGLGNPKVAKT